MLDYYAMTKTADVVFLLVSDLSSPGHAYTNSMWWPFGVARHDAARCMLKAVGITCTTKLKRTYVNLEISTHSHMRLATFSAPTTTLTRLATTPPLTTATAASSSWVREVEGQSWRKSINQSEIFIPRLERIFVNIGIHRNLEPRRTPGSTSSAAQMRSSTEFRRASAAT